MSSRDSGDAVADRRAWTAATLDAPEFWNYSLSQDCLSLLEEWTRSWPKASRLGFGDCLSESQLKHGREFLRPVLEALDQGRGFAVVQGVSMEKHGSERAQALYWATGQLLGVPFEQNLEGALLFDVRDYGGDVTQGARFSVTNAESSFHTDNSFGEPVPDYIGLLCLRTAKSGGRSQLVSAYTVHNELLKLRPEALDVLGEPYHFDRRGGFKVGEAATLRNPVFRWENEELTCRYLRYYIEVGHEKAGEPLTVRRLSALESVESVLRRTDLRAQFDLMPGQMLFANNRWILHNRTAFEDFPDPNLRRHYVRLWLKRRPKETLLIGS